MNKFVIIALSSISICAGQVYAFDEIDYEPCINGSVSSTGFFLTQALEDEALRNAIRDAETKKTATRTITENEMLKVRAVENSAR